MGPHDLRRPIGAKMFNGPGNFRRMWLRFLSCLAIGLASLPAGATDATTLCADARELVRQAHSNFSSWTAGTSDAAVPLVMSGAEDCAITRSPSGAKTYHCTWKFPYRAAGAYRAFDAFNQSLQDCFGDPVGSSEEQAVNHPDFYDLRRYRSGDAELAVSIKDKSALTATYLFLRVRGADLD